MDLAPYTASGVSKAMIDGVYCGIQDPGFRVQIKHNKIYIAGEVKGFQSRNRNVKLALLDLATHYQQLPAADFVIGTADFSASEVLPVPGMTEGGPVFAQVRICVPTWPVCRNAMQRNATHSNAQQCNAMHCIYLCLRSAQSLPDLLA